MNYDKWSKLDADGEEEEDSVDAGTEIERLKVNADSLFEANESKGGSMVSYQECIGMYQTVLHLIDEKKEFLEVSVKCQLNLACCFIREFEWQLAIKHAQLAFQLCTEENWNEKLRARYFEFHALCQLTLQTKQASRAGLHAQLVQAEKKAADMKRSLQFHAALISPEHAADYERVFQQVEECVARVDRDVEAVVESHYEKALQHQRGGSDLKVPHCFSQSCDYFNESDHLNVYAMDCI